MLVMLTKAWGHYPIGAIVHDDDLPDEVERVEVKGGVLSREDFPDLYAVVGDAFGDFGSTPEGHFRLPDLGD